MAFITYRVSSTPTVPVSNTVKNASLTNEEIDGNFKSVDNELATKAPSTNPTLVGPYYTTTALGNSGTTTQTLSAATASVYTLTATGTFTIAFSGFVASKTGYIQLILTNGGSQTITWPTITWIKSDGTTTTSIGTYLSSITGRTALQTSGVDQFIFWSNDGGTTVYGKII